MVDGDDGKRYVEGYGIVFGQESRMLGGWFIEVIERSAVENAMKVGDSVDVDAYHMEHFLLGRSKSGTAKFSIDDTGVKYRAEMPNTSYANDLAELIDRGDIDGSSFVFTIAPEGDRWEKIERGGIEIWKRTITNMERIYNMGPVVNEAYPQTTTGMRSFNRYAEKSGLPMRVTEEVDERTGEKRAVFFEPTVEDRNQQPTTNNETTETYSTNSPEVLALVYGSNV